MLLIGSSRISASPMYKDVYTACQDFNVVFTNQSVPNLARHLWNNFDSPWKQSVFNNELSKLYLNNESSMWVSAFYDIIPHEQIKANYPVAGIDQAKQYSSICSKGDFYYHDV